MRIFKLATLCAPLALAMNVQADELPMKPGLWKTTTNVTSPFGGGVTTKTSEECVTETSYDPSAMMEDVQDCEFTKNEVDGNELNFVMECNMQGARTTMVGRFQTDGDSGNGDMTMNMDAGGMKMEMKMDWTAERLGDC